jgi:hypothetical protein
MLNFLDTFSMGVTCSWKVSMTETVYYVMSVKRELSIRVMLNTNKVKGKMLKSRKGYLRP